MPAAIDLPGLHVAARNDAGVGSAQAGVAAAQGHAVALRARGRFPGLRLHQMSAQFVEGGGADQLFLHQAFAAAQVDLRQLHAGGGFRMRGLGLAQVAVERAVVQFEQQLAARDFLADVDVQGGDAQAGQFDAELHLLPRRNRTGSEQPALDAARADRRQRDGERASRRLPVGARAGLGGRFGAATAGQCEHKGQHQRRRVGRRFKQANVHARIVPRERATFPR